MRSFSRLFFVLLILCICFQSFGQDRLVKPVPSIQELDSIQHLLSITGASRLHNTFVNQTDNRTKKQSLQKIIPLRSGSDLNRGNAFKCFDTSVRLTYTKNGYWISPDLLTRTHDGNILIPGWDEDLQSFTITPHLLKCTMQGDTIWSRRIDNGYPRASTDLYHAFELKDGSIILAGNLSVPMQVNGRQDLILTKLSSTGSFIWQKTFMSALSVQDTTDGSMFIYDCKEDAAGNIYLCGDIWYYGPSRASLVFKMDRDGNVLWSKGFYVHNSPVFSGMDLNNDTLKVFGHFIDSYANTIALTGIAFNPQTGDTLMMKCWEPQGAKNYMRSIYTRGVTKLTNGNYAVYGTCLYGGHNYDSTELTTEYGITELTPDFNVVKHTLFQSSEMNSANLGISVFKDGSAAYVRQTYISSYSADVVFGSIQNEQIVKERVIPYRGISNGWTSNFLQLDDGGQLVTNWFGDSATNTGGIELIRLHNSDTSGSCLGSDTTITLVTPSQLFPARMPLDSINNNMLIEKLHPFRGVYNDQVVIGSNCKQVSYCDSLKLSVSRDSVCVGMPVSVFVKKNKACGAIPAWSFDTTGVQSFNRLNDTTMSITFRKPWRGYISAVINGCSLLQDSVKVTALQAPARLSLGSDTVVCPGNTIMLNAKNGYASYRWQDGSKDSVYAVTKPGTYYVSTVNACGDVFSDTVVVASHPPIPFDAGPDLTICKGDTVSVSAQAGFMHYQWSPYQISTDTGRTVKIFPAADTMYTIIAEQTPGCFAADSFLVKLKQIPAIRLGYDTSFCAGDSLLLNAGNGFDNYQWSTGSVASSIIVNKAGSFAVKGTKDGCTASDTIQVQHVYPLPTFSLGNDTTLCNDQQCSYTFSLPSASYLWSTGSVANTQTLPQAGTYWLQVTQNGCAAADTITLSYKPFPTVQLINDTVVCAGTTVLLDASYPGAQYLWQDGSHEANYSVHKEGVYKVMIDLNGCTASDSVIIHYKPLPYFSLGKDTFVCVGQQLVLKPSINTPANYNWQDGSKNSSFTVMNSGIYYLTAANDCGSYTDSINITIGACKLVMPTAFTPNRDGLNDVFKIKYPFPTKQFHMAVYNRFGQKVFESFDIFKGWNGTINNIDQDAGTYIWMISLVDNEGATQTGNGTVLLLK